MERNADFAVENPSRPRRNNTNVMVDGEHPLFGIDDTSTILTSSTLNSRSVAATSYDSLTYSSESECDHYFFHYPNNNHHQSHIRNNIHNSSLTTSLSSGLSLSSGVTSGSSNATLRTTLSSEQLIDQLRRLQQQRHPGLQPFSTPPSLFPRSYHDEDYDHDDDDHLNDFTTPSNVYRPRSMLDGFLHSNSSHPQQRLLLQSPTHARTLRACCTSPRVLMTVAVCGIILFNLVLGNSHKIEEWWELGFQGMSGQHTAHLAQAKLVPVVSETDFTPLQLKKADNVNGKNKDNNSTNTILGCEATIMLIRHCEKGNLKSHCSFMGYERSVYLSTLFGDDKRWPAPTQIYALSKGRKHKLNFREIETVQAISNAVHVPINFDYSILDTKALAHALLKQLLNGELCGKLILVSWKHSDISKLAQHLGCGPLQGCPLDYKGSDFDSTWQIRYVFTNFLNSQTGLSEQKWNIYGSVQREKFDPLAFSKSVGDYPPGGTLQSTLANWGKDANLVFYG